MTSLILLTLLQTPVEEAKSEHYRLLSTYRDKAYVRTAADSLESGYKTLARVLDLPGDDTKPYTIRLYATRAEYEAALDALAPGWMRSAPAVADEKTNEAFFQPHDVAGSPPSEGFVETLHHESFHLFTHRHAPWINRAPRWLIEGLAERAAELCMGTQSLWFGSRLRQVQIQRGRRAWMPLDDLLSPPGDLDSGRPFYPEAWLLVKYLAEKRPEAWSKFLKAQRELPEKQRGDARTRRLLLEAVGATSTALEEAWGAWIETLLPPPWRQLIGNGRLEKEEIDSISGPMNQSILLWSDPVEAEKYSLAGEVRIEEAGGRQADIVFVPSWDFVQSNSWKVALDAKQSKVLIYVRKSGAWTAVSEKRVDPKKLPTGAWISVEVEVAGRSVKVKAGGETLHEAALEDLGVEMRQIFWGVGGFDSWTRFRAMKLSK